MPLGNQRNYCPAAVTEVYQSMPQTLYAELTVGRNDYGHDVKLYGATSGRYWLWDESADTATMVGNANITPFRTTDDYAYGVKIDSDVFFTGGAAKKSYLFHVEGDRTASYTASGDSNDALIRCTGNNYAANDENFIFRAINASINNRSGGTLGRMDNNVSVQNKSGGTCPTLLGLTVTAENYGTCATEFGGVDIVLKNEAAVATTEYGLRIRNLNNSIADAVGSAILVTDTGANTGFDYGLNLYGSSIVVADIRVSTGNCMLWSSAAPTTGTWAVGDVVWNTGAAAGGSPGWVCTTAGTPGTWKTMANLAS